MTAASRLSAARLLLVDDDPDIAELMALFLRRRVAELWIAHDGMEGLELWRQHRPDVVVTDQMMPQMSGMEMARLIRAEAPEAAIVLTSAAEADEVRGAEVDQWVPKPVDLAQLIAAIESVLDGCAAADPAVV